MKLFYLFLCNVLTTTFAIQNTFIRNIDKPPCIHCKHYLPDPTDRFDSSTAKCTMFGGKDTHTGMVLYEDAVSVRRDDIRCSEEGKYFEVERYFCLKQAEHMVQRTGPLVGFSLFVFLLIKIT